MSQNSNESSSKGPSWAEELREEIRKRKQPSSVEEAAANPESEEPEVGQPQDGESPRDFIERRMREKAERERNAGTTG